MGAGITNSILLMLVIMLSINVGLSFSQSAVDDLRHVSIITTDSSPLKNYYNGSLQNGTSLITMDLLPADNVISGDTGNIFTDTYVALKSYVKTGSNTLGFFVNVLVQPAGFLGGIGVPSAICLAIQIIWSMIFIILITAWIMGRS
jgi:hypothetical protein